MKGLMIFLTIAMVFCIATYFGVLKFVNTKGKDILAGYIEKSFDTKAQIGSLYFKFPFNIEIKNFSCGDISFSKANVFGGFYNPFMQQLVLNSVVVDGFNIKITRDKEKIYITPFYNTLSQGKVKVPENKGFIMPCAYALEQSPASVLEKDQKFSFKINSLLLRNSGGQFVDLALSNPVTFYFKDAVLKVRNFEYPKLSKFNINLNTSFHTDEVKEGNIVDVSGWIDYFYKDMNVNAVVNDINGFTFNDYYSSFWKLEKLGVKEVVFALRANLNSQHNDMIIDSELSLEKIDFGEETENVLDQTKYLKTVIALLKGNKDRASINIKLKTKMDSPKLDFASVKNNFKGVASLGAVSIVSGVIDKIKEVEQEPNKEDDGSAEETTNKTVETIKDVIDTIKDLF